MTSRKTLHLVIAAFLIVATLFIANGTVFADPYDDILADSAAKSN